MKETLGEFNIDQLAMRYSGFVPRLYNWCRSLGFARDKIMPSRAFCSDESQGYPIIMLAKHFGTFPFDHGQVGGIVATDRHGPYAQHGKDLVIIHASHVGYDPGTSTFGTYRRLQTEGNKSTADCGKISAVLSWYQAEYDFAKQNIYLSRDAGNYLVTIDNQLLRDDRPSGLFLNLDKILKRGGDGDFHALRSLSTAKSFHLADTLLARLSDFPWSPGKGTPIGGNLSLDLFYFRKEVSEDPETRDPLEMNLIRFMPDIITSPSPPLTAAQANTQVEFDRVFRTIVNAKNYWGKKLVYISGINIDVSPHQGQMFPLTKFVPWAAYVQDIDRTYYTLEQAELFARLNEQPPENPDQIDLESAIQVMGKAEEISIRMPD
jgi:hypothetical protein